MVEGGPDVRDEGSAPVEVYWRRGCASCIYLRHSLHRLGIPTVERNIWSDERARDFVRSVNGGDETVPTVVIAGRAYTNPSPTQVVDVLERDAPGVLASAARRTAARRARRRAPVLAAAWGTGAMLVWVVMSLAIDATFHLHPALVGIAVAWGYRGVRRTAPDLRSGAVVVAISAVIVAAGGSVITFAGRDLDASWMIALVAAAGIAAGLALWWRSVARHR